MAIQGFTCIKSEKKFFDYFLFSLWNFQSFHSANMGRLVNLVFFVGVLVVNGQWLVFALTRFRYRWYRTVFVRYRTKATWKLLGSAAAAAAIAPTAYSVIVYRCANMCVRSSEFVRFWCVCKVLYVAYGIAYLLCANRVIQSISILIWLCAYSFKPFSYRQLSLFLSLFYSVLTLPQIIWFCFMSVRAIDSD